MILPMSRRTFLQGLGTTLVTGSLTACTINASRTGAFIDQKAFNTRDLVDYLKRFEIRANSSQFFHLQG